MVAFASLIVLTREPLGTQAMLVCLAAAGVAWRSPGSDAVVPDAADRAAGAARRRPASSPARWSARWPAPCSALLVDGVHPAEGAIAGLVAGRSAVLVDLRQRYTEAGRQLAGRRRRVAGPAHAGPAGRVRPRRAGRYVRAVVILR